MDSTKNVLNYFSFYGFTKFKIKKTIKGYNITIPKIVNTKYKSMYLLYGCAFLNDIVNYYNDDLALTASICTSLPVNRETEKKLCYHLENYYFRLISCWDYLFIGLNEYLHTELIASRDIKQKIIEENLSVSIPIQHEKGYTQILHIPLEEEEKSKVEKRLKKELIVLTPANLKDVINKKYEMNDYIKQIFDLYNTEKAVQQAKTIRNSIIHSDSLTKNFNFDVSDLFKGQVISSKSIDDTANKVDLVFINMQILRKAIILLNKMITLDLFPNRIENKLKEYYIQVVKCKDCEKESFLPADFVETLNHNPFCCYCDSESTELIEKVKVSEPYYEQVLIKFIEDTNEYIEQNFDCEDEK